jgi:hypothetical protein
MVHHTKNTVPRSALSEISHLDEPFHNGPYGAILLASCVTVGGVVSGPTRFENDPIGCLSDLVAGARRDWRVLGHEPPPQGAQSISGGIQSGK